MNSHIIYTHLIKKTNRRKFVIDIVEALCATQHPDAQPPQRPPQRAVGPAGAAPVAPIATNRLVLLEGKKEKRCFVCSTPAQRKRSRHWCPACKVGCHEKCEAQLTHEDNKFRITHAEKKKSTG